MMSGAQATVLGGRTEEVPPMGYKLLLAATGCSEREFGESAFECLRRVPGEVLLEAEGKVAATYGPK